MPSCSFCELKQHTERGKGNIFSHKVRVTILLGSTILRMSYLANIPNIKRGSSTLFHHLKAHPFLSSFNYYLYGYVVSWINLFFILVSNLISSYSCWHKGGVETPGGGETFPFSSNKLLFKSNLSSTLSFQVCSKNTFRSCKIPLSQLSQHEEL